VKEHLEKVQIANQHRRFRVTIVSHHLNPGDEYPQKEDDEWCQHQKLKELTL
jgi:hypothetical protein